MRATEVHAAASHYPLAFLPVAFGADIAGRLTGSTRLQNLGRIATPAATAAAAATAATGLIAERRVQTDDEGAKLLEQHRTINIVTLGSAMAMSGYRATRQTPGWGYLAAGLGALGAINYSAYLGGKMVYHHGVGVEYADGTREQPGSPPVRTVTDGLRAAGRWVVDGVRGLFENIRTGLLDYGPDRDEMQRSIEVDNASGGALPLATTQRPQ